MLETYSYSGDRRILDRALTGDRPARRSPGTSRLDRGPPVARSHGHSLRGHPPCRPWSISGPATRVTCQADAGRLPVAGREPRAPLRRRLWRGVRLGVGAFRKTETCDVTSMLLASSWMYRIRGRRPRGATAWSGPSSTPARPQSASDFKTMCYYQSPNRLQLRCTALRAAELPRARRDPVPPPRLPARFFAASAPSTASFPNYIIHMWMATRRRRTGGHPVRPLRRFGHGRATGPVRITTDDGLSLRREDPHGAWSRSQGVGLSALPSHSRLVRGGGDYGQWRPVPDAARTTRICARSRGHGKRATWSNLRFPMGPRVLRGFETEFPAANRDYFNFVPAAVFQPAAAAVCERCLRAVAVLAADCRRGSEHAGERCEMAIRPG